MDWKTQDTAWRLRPGAHLFRHADDCWILCTPAEEFARISLPEDIAAAFEAFMGGARIPTADITSSSEFGDVLDALYEEGLLAPVMPEGALGAVRAHRILLVGDNPLARVIADLFRASGAEVRESTTAAVDPPDLDGIDCIVAASGWLPDAEWVHLDEWCESAAKPWHRAYIEGERVYLGPLSVPGVSASYRDLRLRRIAASPWPEELQAHWRALDTGIGIGEVDWPDHPTQAAAAAALVRDVLGCLNGGEAGVVPGTVGQMEFDSAAWTWRIHPVLPIPRGIMTVSP